METPSHARGSGQCSIAADDYRRALAPFARASREWIRRDDDRRFGWYGTGTADHWSIQTCLKGMAALAVLAAEADSGASPLGVSREELRDDALACLRFALATHVSGHRRCLDGRSWGHSWITALGLERAFHGIDALGDALTAADHADLHRVVADEAGWLLRSYTLKAGLLSDNHPENNLWNGALLHRAAVLMPDHADAGAWRQEAIRFVLNGLSMPADATDGTVIGGRPLRDWHVGPNLFPTAALNHHGYLNVGYQVICLSQIALLHFWCAERQVAPPPGLDHHAPELWHLVKRLTFADGRLARIGGDTRMRYGYCQDYAISAWLWALDRLGDRDVIAHEAGWLAQVERETGRNADDHFCSARLAPLRRVSPTYFTRLESDRACGLSLGLWWRRRHALPAVGAARVVAPGSWHDAHHGAVLVQGRKRFASACRVTAELSTVLALPLDGSDLAEWRGNLCPVVAGLGKQQEQLWQRHGERLFDGGFVWGGRWMVRSRRHVAEGQAEEDVALVDAAIAALPDDATVVAIHRAAAPPGIAAWLGQVQGLNLLIPNDVFNGGERRYQWHGGEERFVGPGSAREVRDLPSRWVGVDGRLAVAVLHGADAVQIHRPGERQIGLRLGVYTDNWDAGGSLWCDELCTGRRAGPFLTGRGETLLDASYAVVVGPDQRTGPELAQAAGRLAADGALRVLRVPGRDDVTYVVAAHLGDAPASFTAPARLERRDRPGNVASAAVITLDPGEIAVFAVV